MFYRDLRWILIARYLLCTERKAPEKRIAAAAGIRVTIFLRNTILFRSSIEFCTSKPTFTGGVAHKENAPAFLLETHWRTIHS